MRRGKFIHVVDFAVRSAASMKRLSIPRCIPFFRVADGSRRQRVAFPGGGRRGRFRHIGRAFRGFFGCRRGVCGLRRRQLPAAGYGPARTASGKTNAKNTEDTEFAEKQSSRTQRVLVAAESGKQGGVRGT